MELKHWAAFLPYNLEVITKDSNEKKQKIFVYALDFNHETDRIGAKKYFESGGRVDIWYNESDVKPILRPMSHLTKEIEHKGEKFVPYEALWNAGTYLGYLDVFLTHALNNFSTDFGLEYIVNATPYFIIQKLLEWHFDVFGLIEKGEAIAKE